MAVAVLVPPDTFTMLSLDMLFRVEGQLAMPTVNLQTAY